MKKIFLIRFILVFLALTIQFSCSNYLELVPTSGVVRKDFWKTKEDVKSVLMGAYLTFAGMNGNLFTYGEARGDMVQAGGSLGGDQRNLLASNITSGNGLCNWADFYAVINVCNEVIKNAPNVRAVDNTFTDFQLKGYLAEAYYLRSLSYFYLVRIFKDVPLVLEPSETDNVDFYLPQTKGEDILKVIIADLEEYRKYINDGYPTLAELKGRATPAAFDALLADIYLWNFDYTNCIKYCRNIIANKNYILMPSARWFELYYPGNSLESIFEIQFDQQLSQNNAIYDMTNRFANQYLPSQQANDLFGNGSLEKDRGTNKTLAPVSTNNYLIWKYAGRQADGISVRSSSEQKSCNFIIYRLADVYLMYAEALSQLGQYNEAYEYLNIIRERAEVTYPVPGNSPTEFEDAIMDERCLELAYEGKRWFDILRMGRRNNFSRKSKVVDILIKNVPSTSKRILGAKLTNPLGWYLPVSKSEIERNKNLVQNPYYIL